MDAEFEFRQVIKGVKADAQALGVSTPHLSMVLHGKRTSKSLLRRYRELKEQQRADAEAESETT